MIETDTTDATIEDTNPDLKRGGEIEADQGNGQKRSGGSGAIPKKEEEVGDIKTESGMGQEIEIEIGGIRNGAGVGRSIDRDEVGA